MGGGKIEARGGGGGRRAGSAVWWSSSDNPHRLADQSVEQRQRGREQANGVAPQVCNWSGWGGGEMCEGEKKRENKTVRC